MWLTMSRYTPATDVMNHALRVYLAVMAHVLFHCNGVGNERTYGRVEEPKNRRGLYFTRLFYGETAKHTNNIINTCILNPI